MRGVKKRLAGWGNFPSAECLVLRPRTLQEAAHPGAFPSLLWRGAGRAYGDMALNPGGVLETANLDCVRAFDRNEGVITAEAGMRLSDILRVIVPAGWFLPVLPGTAQATIGGALACNVHGKNHPRAGDLGEHVEAFDLRLADGRRLECTPEDQPGLFAATIGGMGMTGGIETVTLRLMKIASACLRMRAVKTSTFEAMIEAFEQNQDEYAVGWIDHFASPAAFGRGLIEFASHIGEDDGTLHRYQQASARWRVPCFLPEKLLQPFFVKLYNRWHFATAAKPERRVPFERFFHPLDRIGQWNRLYGRGGFVQYQCLLPRHPGVAGDLRTLLETCAGHGHIAYLAVVKRHRGGQGPMTFSKDGYSLALDFRLSPGLEELLSELDHRVIERGGRVYLAKDARMRRATFEAMYAATLPEWKSTLRECDPERRWTSRMAERLAFKEV